MRSEFFPSKTIDIPNIKEYNNSKTKGRKHEKLLFKQKKSSRIFYIKI